MKGYLAQLFLPFGLGLRTETYIGEGKRLPFYLGF